MKMQKSNIAYNLTTLRQLNKFSQEEVAERIGVSRQAVAKWEAGQSVPDILNCDALAKLYDVELDDLIHYDQGQTGESIPPKGKHIFGTVRVGERGQIVLPKQARDVFKIKPGDMLVVLGDAVFDLVFLTAFYKSGYKVGKSFILAAIPMVFLMVAIEATSYIPALVWIDSYQPEHLLIQLPILIVGIVCYGVLVPLAYRISAKRFEKVDL